MGCLSRCPCLARSRRLREPAEPTAPGAPNLTAANPGNDSVALNWTAPVSNGGSPITGYEI